MTLLLDTKGAHRVTLDELHQIETPPPTDTWKPIGHSHVLDMVMDTLDQLGFQVKSTDLAVAHEGQQFFGTLDLRHGIAEGVDLAVGVRNSTDKSLSAAMCAGERVFVCSNLAFGSEIQIARKHTANVESDFNVRVMQAVLKLRQYAQVSRERISGMQNQMLTEHEADSIILKAYEKGVLGARLLKPMIQEWREPSYEEFEPRNSWSLFNSFTHVLKGRQEDQPIAAAQEVIRFQNLVLAA